MKKSILAIVLIAAMSITMFAGCTGKTATTTKSSKGNTATTISGQQSATTDTDGDGIPDTVEKVYGTNPYTADTDGDGINDKNDQKPLFAENPISETSTTVLPIKIVDVRVEDNATADHLEIKMKNTGNTELSNFDIYFTITDKVESSKVEGYYLKLTGLTIKAGDTATIHFDNDVSQSGHFYGNMNGLYGTSANGLAFAIQLHANGYAPINFTVDKAKGTAEVAD
ncbi:MAG: hypothetical protein WCN92_06095 [Eubacteriales bacterium]